MFEIPLFPLNTVLFPGTPIHLHIFEERYKQMINACLREKRPFGVVLIRNGMEAMGPLAEPFHIGCTAEIAQVQRLEDEQMNLVAVGLERIRILSFDSLTQPYLVGKVRTLPVDQPGPRPGVGSGQHVAPPARAVGRRFYRKQGAASWTSTSSLRMAISLAFLAAAVLQISPLQKQELLSIERAR